MRPEAGERAGKQAGDAMTDHEHPMGRETDRQPKRVLAYAKAASIVIPVLGGLIMGLLGIQAGDTAQKSGDQIWTKLRTKVNAQSVVINKLHLRMVAFQARQEGETAATLQSKLDALQARYDRLAARQAVRGLKGDKGRLAEMVRELIERQKKAAASRPAPKPKKPSISAAPLKPLPKGYRPRS